ncbi:DUF3397 domain-containing protein [Sporosarcina thermotolerans]|uniref:DUF3397 domain-containing protein n=1 Tax=Sporosarcina thermotolerans TaxID=633404 RepID=UPI0024BCA8CD|nr:DUF3397 domain-containing protein [Sporosarcina thermotolerans]WHT46941.1 DUF3397 domain-containing protein [Sporosarcina thermotolerans]
MEMIVRDSWNHFGAHWNSYCMSFSCNYRFSCDDEKNGKAPARVLGQAADWTTPFLFLAVYISASAIFGDGVGYYIVGIAIFIAILQAVIERMKVKEFIISRFLQKTWRLYFLVLGLSYLVLIVTGIIFKVSEYVK